MKNFLLLALAILCSNSSLFSQDLPIPTKWKVKKVGFSFGADKDMIKGMDGDYLLSTGKDISIALPGGIDLSPEMYAGVCENPHMRITAVLEVPKLKNTELQLGVNAFFNRFDGAYYESGNSGYDDYEYLSVYSMSHELGLETAIAKRFYFSNYLNLYGGIGTNLGYSIGDELGIYGNNLESVNQNINRSRSDIVAGSIFDDHTYHSFEAKDAFHQRVFLQAGISLVILEHLELGIDYRGGIGYKSTMDGPTRSTRLHSFGLTNKWIF